MTKLLLYNTLIRSVQTYAAETWTLTYINEEKPLSSFERKALRSIFRGVKNMAFSAGGTTSSFIGSLKSRCQFYQVLLALLD